MTHTDTYLRFPDEATATPLLFDADGVARHANTDVIGLIYESRELDALPIEGWHVNIRLLANEKLAPALVPYVIPAPSNPTRMWA